MTNEQCYIINIEMALCRCRELHGTEKMLELKEKMLDVCKKQCNKFAECEQGKTNA